MSRRAVIVLLLGVLLNAAPAHAAFPGTDGKIAFDSDRDGNNEIYTMAADGTGQTRITTNAVFDARPAWSADGKKIAWESQNAVWVMNADGTGQTQLSPHPAMEPAWSPDGRVAMSMDGGIFVINADGTGGNQITSQPSGPPDSMPAWSPDGTKIAFMRFTGSYDVWVMNADGTGQVNLTPATATADDYQPNWSADGHRIAFASNRSGNFDVWVMNSNGAAPTQLTTDPALDQQPAFSPTGSKIAFETARNGRTDIYSMNADGTAQTQLTTNVAGDSSPDWQPIPFTGYARPKGASPTRLSMVPAYGTCTSSNTTHGAPLAFGACKPPAQTSSYLTVGTPDANGAAANSIGSVYISVLVGAPGPPVDSSFNAGVSVTDVRCTALPSACGSANASGGPDYVGELEGRITLRITDKKNGPSLNEPATMTDYTLAWPVSCGATSSLTTGSVCSFPLTCMDAVVPGLTPEGTRDVWELVKVELNDGGADGDADTADNSLFAKPGVFVP
jgi:Tol biopolymer transport system component